MPDVIPGHPRLVDSLGKAFNACPDCAFKACPKANNPDGICDVCDEMSETRAAQIAKGSYIYKEKVDKKRVLFKKKPIVYAEMKVSVHCDELSNEAYAALVESLVDEEDDVEAEFSMMKSTHDRERHLLREARLLDHLLGTDAHGHRSSSSLQFSFAHLLLLSFVRLLLHGQCRLWLSLSDYAFSVGFCYRCQITPISV